jgi:hypothetical protein
MPTHVKPTPEELEEKRKKILEELENDEEDNENPEEEPSKADDDAGDEGKPDEDIEGDDNKEEEKDPAAVADEEDGASEQEDHDEEEVEDKKELPPVEDRYKESTKEAQKLAADKKALDDALHEANNLPEPTEDELKVEFPEWAEMSATEQKLAKDSLINKQFREVLQKAEGERRGVSDWFEKVDAFIENPKTLINYQELEGKQEDFKLFAKDKKNRGVGFHLLIPAFLHTHQVEVAKQKKNNKGQMFETGSGGSKEKEAPKDDKLSTEEAEKLRNSDYKKYTEYLKAGKLSTDIA